MSDIPAGYKPIDAFTNGREIVVPEQKNWKLPEDHNCDEMGCSSVAHVSVRVQVRP